MTARDKAYNRLQHAVCAGMGFCGGIVDGKPSHVDFFIPDSGTVTVAQFIEWLLKAEDYYPDQDPRFSPYYKELSRIFVEIMGADTVDAARLKWDV
ncbi:MAG: hypothetical protein KJZ64_15075 [Sphingomonadaceae bacterium]|nr:hypothetical protein [Sphingomonadaceae bacterium]